MRDLAIEHPIDLVSELMAHALRDRLTDEERLRAQEDLMGRVGGRRTYLAALARLDRDVARSRGRREVDLLRAIMAARLPRPVLAYELRDDDGRLIAEIDLAYPAYMVAIEVDGYLWHSTPQRKRYDEVRQNRLVVRGWRVLRFSTEDIDQRPAWVVAQITAALRAAGAAV